MNKILMIEGEISTVKRAQELFSNAGYEMYAAFDGRLGLHMAKEKVPDLIIADANIPLMSGIELCKAIKLNETTKSIPIIVLTEKHLLEESFMYLGISDFLNKPFSMEQLEAVVRYKLKKAQTVKTEKTKILINGRPEIISCCQELLKTDPHWEGYYSLDKDSLLRDAIEHTPDVIFIDLLMPEVFMDEIIMKLKLIPELKNSVILTYYSTASTSRDPISIQAQMIEVQYMKIVTQEAGAREYLGLFNPLTFLNLINFYRKDFDI